MIISPQTKNLVRQALKEDLGLGDVTTQLIVSKSQKNKAVIFSNSSGIVTGLPLVLSTFKLLDSYIKFKIFKQDGSKIRKRDKVLEIFGKTSAILSAERTALNFLQHLSGIATFTGQFVRKVQGTRAKICDSRKTTPLWREMEKYTVRMGGAENHRMGLYDMVLIKDNHIQAAGSITEAIRLVQQKNKKRLPVEVETKNLAEVKAALKSGVNFIMLDNFSIKNLKKAVKIIRQHEKKSKRKIKIEASGNVNLENVRKIALTGVDLISVGKITHSVPALDFSLKLI